MRLLHNRAELYHVKHHALYRAIDQPHSRHRRLVPARQAIERLMRLDSIVLSPDIIWLGTEEETSCRIDCWIADYFVARTWARTVAEHVLVKPATCPASAGVGCVLIPSVLYTGVSTCTAVHASDLRRRRVSVRVVSSKDKYHAPVVRSAWLGQL
jgi:hypothetical protein